MINDLLDLTKTEEGGDLVQDEVFDLSHCIKEATEPYRNDTQRKGLVYEVIEHPGLPQFVHGDGRRVRQAISNVTANAVTHTREGYVKIEVFVSELREGQAVVDFVIADSGKGMSTRQLDALFRDLEQVSTEEPESPEETLSQDFQKPADTRTLGLGLALVARIVRNMDGQLRLKSEEGEGSRFVVQLPFHLPIEASEASPRGADDGSEITKQSNTAASPAPASLSVPPEGEITLVDRGSAINASMDGRATGEQASRGSRHSIESHGSMTSQKSDADRLIDALQTPLSLHDKEPVYPVYPVSRQNSVGSSGKPKPKASCTFGTESANPEVHPQPESPTLANADNGFANVRDTKTPIRAVKVPDEYADMPPQPQVGDNSGILFEIPTKPPTKPNTKGAMGGEPKARQNFPDGQSLRVLIAEDDPINMKIMRKRLERGGHEISHAENGQDCAALYKERSSQFDVVLMDMQVRIMIHS